MIISWTLVNLWTGLNATMAVGVNGAKSILTIFMQFLPTILILAIVLFIISFLLARIKWISFMGWSWWPSKWHFTSSQRH